ncbi:hypothetical protein ABI_39650 [Asticcacaulis biprosthecium C19]|uniref:Uncharacterized protein n=1 Tax=Asticcacaulis biprosthecium C19 TaxID=715226 RepID=F4QS30_9CAUL|nr:hypothetical protein ABI_39650 [Asticcacaulis biprosthecium C19]
MVQHILTRGHPQNIKHVQKFVLFVKPRSGGSWSNPYEPSNPIVYGRLNTSAIRSV